MSQSAGLTKMSPKLPGIDLLVVTRLGIVRGVVGVGDDLGVGSVTAGVGVIGLTRVVVLLGLSVGVPVTGAAVGPSKSLVTAGVVVGVGTMTVVVVGGGIGGRTGRSMRGEDARVMGNDGGENLGRIVGSGSRPGRIDGSATRVRGVAVPDGDADVRVVIFELLSLGLPILLVTVKLSSATFRSLTRIRVPI